MAGEPPVICSQCGHVLGPKEEEIAHPNDDNPPDDPHFKVQIRDDDEERLQCLETGRLAAPVGPGDDGIGGDNKTYAEVFKEYHGEMPPGMGEPQGGGGQPSQPGGRQATPEGGIYDVEEEKDQMDLLNDVITNPRYGLNDDHIREVKGWADDMDGRLPPATLQDILKNLKGVQKQTAKLIRQRYELKLNRWMRQQQSDEEGPPIGVSTGAIPAQRGSGSGNSAPSPTPHENKKEQKQKGTEEERKEQAKQERGRSGPAPNNLREFRRTRRTKRRQEVLDITAQRAAEQAADEIAREFVSNFGTYFGLPAKILEAKIEKDPDWALEKAEQLDIDLFELMEPSEQRKKEKGGGGQQQAPQVDNEVDNALEQIKNSEMEPEQKAEAQNRADARQTSETTNNPPQQDRDASPMSASPEEDGFTPEPEEPQEQEGEDSREGAEMFD